jgi:hypothetical protein
MSTCAACGRRQRHQAQGGYRHKSRQHDTQKRQSTCSYGLLHDATSGAFCNSASGANKQLCAEMLQVLVLLLLGVLYCLLALRAAWGHAGRQVCISRHTCCRLLVMSTWEQHHLQTNPCLESHLVVTAFAVAAAAAHATAAAGDGCCARCAAALVAPAALTAALGHKTEQSFQGRLRQARGTATAVEFAQPQHLTWLSCTKGVHAGQLQCSRCISLDCIIALKVADATERLQQSTCFDRSARTLCQEHALQIHSHSQHIPGQSAAFAGPPSVATIHSCSPSTAQLLHHNLTPHCSVFAALLLQCVLTLRTSDLPSMHSSVKATQSMGSICRALL